MKSNVKHKNLLILSISEWLKLYVFNQLYVASKNNVDFICLFKRKMTLLVKNKCNLLKFLVWQWDYSPFDWRVNNRSVTVYNTVECRHIHSSFMIMASCTFKAYYHLKLPDIQVFYYLCTITSFRMQQRNCFMVVMGSLKFEKENIYIWIQKMWIIFVWTNY